MAKERNAIFDYLIYLAMRTASMIFHWFPINLNLRTAQLVGAIWHQIDKRHRERAIANLKRSFPEKSAPDIERLARESVENMFMLGVEVLFTTRLIRIDTWRKYVHIADIQQSLQLLMDRKRGLIVLTGHYGNWEVLGYTLGVLGFETTSVARLLDNPYISKWVMDVREKHGQNVVNKKGATAEVTETLGRGGVVAFVADQNAGSKGLFVDFFGRKASTYKSIGLLAMEFSVPVAVGYARRLNHQYQFKVDLQDVIYPQDWQNQDDPLRYITQRFTSAIEAFVREDPGQYFWTHRRWKSRPKGEQSLAFD